MITPTAADEAPVARTYFAREAWRCVWHMIPNDLVHGWGLDLTWHQCAGGGNRSAVDAMGVVDSQPVHHLGVRKARPGVLWTKHITTSRTTSTPHN